MKIKKNIHSTYKKCCKDKYIDLLLTDEGEKKHYVLITDFNTFIYDHTLQHFCRDCLQAYRTTEKLKCHIKDCFKINDKQAIKMPKKGAYIQVKNFGQTIKSQFVIYADFESILWNTKSK